MKDEQGRLSKREIAKRRAFVANQIAMERKAISKGNIPNILDTSKEETSKPLSVAEIIKETLKKRILNFLSKERMTGSMKYFYGYYCSKFDTAPEELLDALNVLETSNRITKNCFKNQQNGEIIIYSRNDMNYSALTPKNGNDIQKVNFEKALRKTRGNKKRHKTRSTFNDDFKRSNKIRKGAGGASRLSAGRHNP